MKSRWLKIFLLLLSLLSDRTTLAFLTQRPATRSSWPLATPKPVHGCSGILSPSRILPDSSGRTHRLGPCTALTAVTPFVRAAGCLSFSALLGSWMDTKIMPNSGILVALASSAVCSALHLAPSAHFLYDLCWTTFLPASLALLLLGMKETPESSDNVTDATSRSSLKTDENVLHVVRRMATPFAIVSLGSLMGCFLSFTMSCWKGPSSFWLSPAQAVVAAACLSASFVGGSVNFFATAAVVAEEVRPAVAINTLVSAMAAADLVVMAVYFALMAAALQSTPLQRWFRGDRVNSVLGEADDSATVPQSQLASSEMTRKATENKSTFTKGSLIAWRLTGSVCVSLFALALVLIGRRIEAALARYIPGTACAFLAVATPALTRLIPPSNAFWKEMQAAAGPLSSFSFLLLFAAIGISADLEAALRSGPACLIFAGLALSVHGIVSLLGCKWSPGKKILFEDVLITSNAAIGGPATAATFCGTLPKNTKALTVAATVWGVFGYAIGTTLGVSVYRALKTLL